MIYRLTLWAVGLLLSVSALAADKPNIILIVLDDWGLGDASFYGNPLIETPAIDRLAREGVVMQQAYAAAPTCAPSRAALMTGLYPHRTRIVATGFSDPEPKKEQRFKPPKSQAGLPTNFLTLPRFMKNAGYHTALIGKWNLGNDPGRGPTAHGFDINIGGYRGGVELSHFAPYPALMAGLQDAPKGEYLTDRLNREAVKFIEQQTTEQPFFLYLAPYAPHAPWHAPDASIAAVKKKFKRLCPSNAKHYPCQLADIYPYYAAMMTHVDRGLAELIAALEQQNLAHNTKIILTADNGGYHFLQAFHGLRGQKSELYEGGIRVPLIFWNWDAKGQRESPVSLMDIFPTLASQVDKVPAGLDGVDISHVIAGQAVRNRELYWYFPVYTADIMRETKDSFSQRPAMVVRQGDYKYIRSLEPNREPELFNLKADPQERLSLHQREPAVRQQFDAQLDAWLTKHVNLDALYPPAAN